MQLIGKKRLMSPLVINRTKLNLEDPDSATRYDEEKFLIYSVFRQKIQDKVLRKLTQEIAGEIMKNYKERPRTRKRKNRSIINGRKIDSEIMKNFKYNPHNKRLIKLK